MDALETCPMETMELNSAMGRLSCLDQLVVVDSPTSPKEGAKNGVVSI